MNTQTKFKFAAELETIRGAVAKDCGMTMMGETMSDAAALNMAIMAQIKYASRRVHSQQRILHSVAILWESRASRGRRAPHAARMQSQLWISTRGMRLFIEIV